MKHRQNWELLVPGLSCEWKRASEITRTSGLSPAYAIYVPRLVDIGLAEVEYRKVIGKLIGFYRLRKRKGLKKKEII